MLKLIQVQSKNQIWNYFNNLDIEHEAWIVSKSSERDLLAMRILGQKKYFLDRSVQLNKSFYQNLYQKVFPDFTIVSEEFAHIYLRRKMTKLQAELGIDIIDEKSRLRSITYYASMLLDPDIDSSKLQEWLEQSQERKLRLKPDLILNKLFLSFFINDKIICDDWILAHLQTADLSDIDVSFSRLYFDLGTDYTVVDATILKKLSKTIDIFLFQTVHEFDSDYKYLLQAYEQFDQLENKSKSEAPQSPAVLLKKFSSAISECRYTVNQIKKWTQQGQSLNEMAIVAPDIRKYKDVLRWQLLAENISINDNRKVTLLEFQDIRDLLADLSFLKEDVEFSDIRLSLMRYHANDKGLGFNWWEEKLNSQFVQTDQLLKMIDDLVPNFFIQHLEMTLSQLLDLRSKDLTVTEFLKITQIFWERMGLSERKEKLLNLILSSAYGTIELSTAEWTQQIEKLALREQASVGIKDLHGLQISSLSQVSLYNLKQVIVLGMSEGGFKSQFKESIPPDDIFNLGSELGVYLAHPDLNLSSFQLEELLSQVQTQVVLSYPYRSIDSAIQNPATHWQNRAFQQKMIEKEMEAPPDTIWDWALTNEKSQWLNERGQEYKLEVQRWDANPLQMPVLSDFSLSEVSLSPSSIQTFIDCRQKFYFQRVMRLKSIESESFDVNARDRGSWYHSLFEKVIEKETEYILPFLNERFTDQFKQNLAKRLEVDFSEIYPKGFNLQTWQLVKKSYFENVVKFIEQEVIQRQHFPELKNIRVEWAWEVFYDWKQLEFVKDKSDSTVKISGVIDRIILNQKTNRLWLIDYKSSLKNHSSYLSWLQNQEFQLLLYNHIVQNFCSEPWAAEVENLSYWQLPNLTMKKGFVVEDARFLALGHSKKDLGSQEDKRKIEAEFLIRFKEIIVQMSKGHFYPLPIDEKNCRYCDWRLACRAPHL